MVNSNLGGEKDTSLDTMQENYEQFIQSNEYTDDLLDLIKQEYTFVLMPDKTFNSFVKKIMKYFPAK